MASATIARSGPRKHANRKLYASIGTKIYAIIAFCFVCFIAVSVYQMVQLKRSLETQRTMELKHLVEVAIGILQEEYTASEAGLLSAPAAKERAAQRIAKLRYGHDDYFWINDLEPKMIMHPMKPELNGKNLSDLRDSTGVRIFVEFARVARTAGAGFVSYSWPKPGASEPQPKISYVAGFAPWGWVVGTGLYTDDLYAEAWSLAKNQLLIIGLVLSIAAGAAILLARSISKALAAMTDDLSRLANGDLKIGLRAKDRNDELGTMGRALSIVAGTLGKFVEAQLQMALAHSKGVVSHEIDAAQFPGVYGEIARNINEMVKTHIDVQNRFAGLMVQYANADFSDRMNPLPGEQQKVSDSCERVRREMEAASKAARYNAQVRAALDHVSVPVRIASDEGEILYINKALDETLHKCEPAFREQIPGFSASAVVGGSIGMFYSDPAAALGRLRSIARLTSSRLVLGGRQYNVLTTPVFGGDGERLGTVGQWIDITEQLAAEKEIALVVEAAAAGDFAKRIAEAGKEGFMLQMSQGINAILSTSETALDEIARILSALSKGDLAQNIEAKFQGVFAGLAQDSNNTIVRLREIIQQIRDVTGAIQAAASEISAGNNDLAHRTEEAASSLEQTAATIEELSATVKLNAENASHANKLALSASQGAARGGEVVAQVVKTMEAISDSSSKIGDITTLIDEIAFQTHLLALNASVEAARAGEHGRGFGVVASEVGALAKRCAGAAKDIKALILGSAGQVDQGAKLVASAGAAMNEIVVSVKRVTEIVGGIAAASNEQSEAIQQVNQAVTQIDQLTQQNAALVGEAAAAAKSMEEQAGGLVQAVSIFKLAKDAGAQSSVRGNGGLAKRPAASILRH